MSATFLRMHYVTDLHLHSKYSRAVSQDMILSTIANMARIKGIDLVSVPDWTHQLWFKELQGQLEEVGEGVYRLKSPTLQEKKQISFVFATEISSIYKDKSKLRRIHNLIFASNMEVAGNIAKALLKKGANLHSDGRPIIGLSSKQLLELVLSVDDQSFLIPCHVWTPHFGMYGSASGYDTIVESFEDLADYIYGIETGLSSDPEMNWQMAELSSRAILSFSDAHSPLKMGREATVIDMPELSFSAMRDAIRRKNGGKIVYSVEFYPEEGKYHYSGHRNCNVVRGPEEIAKDGADCPVCKRRLTEGVMYRVQSLAGAYAKKATVKENDHGLKWFTDPEKKHPPYVKLVPLLEIVAESMGSTVASQKVKNMYYQVCQEFGSELDVLLKTPIADMQKFDERLAEGIQRVRGGTIHIEPGYDNVYGIVKIWDEKSKVSSVRVKEDKAQLSLI